MSTGQVSGVTQGQTPSFSMFTDSTNIGPYILTAIVVALGAMVGYILCFIPGIIWLFFTTYAPLRALDKGEGPGDAIKARSTWCGTTSARCSSSSWSAT
ncbi:MAG: hypothetical protein R2716_00470 [Microthrixaceae bacterium]